MSIVQIINLTKKYGDIYALRDFSFTSYENEFVVIVGGSGCGKTTLLRTVAGLDKVSAGKIILNNRDITNTHPGERNTAMVFQDYALYPNLSVYDNLAFPLLAKRTKKDIIRKQINDVADALEISPLLKRMPNTLSGGQKQRVAIGRALIRNPDLYLFDEPLSNLDASLKDRMREYFISLHKNFGSTFLYVTHDQIEAMSLGSRIIVLNQGIVQQIDTPINIYNFPSNIFVAKFIGSPPMNFLSKQLFELLTNFTLPSITPIHSIGVRPEHITITHQKSTNNNGIISLIEMLGKDLCVHVKFNSETLIVCLPSSNNMRFNCGDKVTCSLSLNRIHYFNEDGMRLNNDPFNFSQYHN